MRFQKLIVVVTLRNLTAYWCVKEPGEEWEKAFALYQFIVLFLVPVATMIFCYTVVGRTLQNMYQQSHFTEAESMSFRKSSARSVSVRLGSISASTAMAQGASTRRHSQTEWGVGGGGEEALNGNQRLLLRKSSRMPDQSVKQVRRWIFSVSRMFYTHTFRIDRSDASISGHHIRYMLDAVSGRSSAGSLWLLVRT